MAKKKNLPSLSEAQLELMNIVWAKGEASVTEVWEGLPADRRVARTTIMTLLVRLERKGWLKRRKSGNEFFYSAAVTREKALGGLLSRLVSTVFGGSAASLVATLVNAQGISAEEAAHLRKVINASAPEPLETTEAPAATKLEDNP